MCNVGDVAKLEIELDLTTGWANEWQLSLSVNKCNILLIWKCEDITPYYADTSTLIVPATRRRTQGDRAFPWLQLPVHGTLCRPLSEINSHWRPFDIN